MHCALCVNGVEDLLWRDQRCRVILAADADYPAYCRVIWNEHVTEMTGLDPADRGYLMQVVFTVEAALRDLLKPDKLNLASLGNQVAHLHWHVIPRFADDAHFPQPVWGRRQRDGQPRGIDRDELERWLLRVLGQR
jgi:diadenosine tetraphosphate (Ap4A) HIT family hydrolase